MSNQQKIINGTTPFPDTPAFFAFLPGTDSNVTGDGTVFQIGSSLAMTTVFDQTGDFNTNGTFTAPVTGWYEFNWGISLFDTNSNHTNCIMLLETTLQDFRILRINPFAVAVPTSQNSINFSGSVFAQMNATDTAFLSLQVSGSGLSVDLAGSPTVKTTWFGGKLSLAT